MTCRLLILLAGLIAAAAPAGAQDAPPAGPSGTAPHRIPVGSGGHAVELALDRAEGFPAGPLAVVVAEAPAWLVFEASRAEAAPAADGVPVAQIAAPTYRFSFAVALAAPLGVPASVTFHVVDADGGVVAVHAVLVEAGPPGALALAAPRPNPSLGGPVTLGWALPEAGPVRVSVFDALGREVAVLAEGEAPAGGYEGRVAAGRLAAGAYVVRLVAGRETRVQRLTVVR